MKQSIFRNLRRKLLNEGKLVRYLTYAIGEVVLIIVGILFALKINDWNEDQKAQAEFDQYVVQLKEDVSLAVESVRSSQEANEERAVQGYSIVEFLKRSEFNPDDLASFEKALKVLGRYWEPQIEIGFLGELLQGNAEIISRNESLYRQVQFEIYRLKATLSVISHVLEATNLRMVKLDEFRGSIHPNFSDSLADYDLDQLRRSSEFIYTTQTLASYLMSTSDMCGGVADRLESLLTVLEEYDNS